jgi:psp operon transcriptional activator
MAAQERLLRAVEYGEVTRIGSSRPVRVDVRIVAATNENLPARAEAGKFRADLLDRLSFEVLTLPPLRAREDDIGVLADFFGRRMAAELGWDRWPGFGPAAQAAMAGYGWPGNVRELRNVCERAIYRWSEPARAIDTLIFDPFASPWMPQDGASAANTPPRFAPPPFVSPPESQDAATLPAAQHAISDLRGAVDAYEKGILEEALARCRYNQKITADALGLSYDQLRHALKRHGLL